jgi:hypothetical protein
MYRDRMGENQIADFCEMTLSKATAATSSSSASTSTTGSLSTAPGSTNQRLSFAFLLRDLIDEKPLLATMLDADKS